jgi:hypothetical protein
MQLPGLAISRSPSNVRLGRQNEVRHHQQDQDHETGDLGWPEIGQTPLSARLTSPLAITTASVGPIWKASELTKCA